MDEQAKLEAIAAIKLKEQAIVILTEEIKERQRKSRDLYIQVHRLKVELERKKRDKA